MEFWGGLEQPVGRGDLGLFLSQETQEQLPPRLVGFLREQTPVMLDI